MSSRTKLYDSKNHRLLFLDRKADASFWDEQWDTPDLRQKVEAIGSKKDLIVQLTKNFLPPAKTTFILEGGCGFGSHVYALDRAGFTTYGVDFAPRIIERLKTSFPELQFFLGDVRQLDFSDNYFDGYWSLGVIEHFWDGYDVIAKEMRRVIKKGGYLFVTFPYLSRLRRLKIALHLYQPFSDSSEPESFYQFALDRRRVVNKFKQLGFKLVESRSLDAAFGLSEELGLGWIYDSRSLLARGSRFVANLVFSWFSGHIILLIFQNEKSN